MDGVKAWVVWAWTAWVWAEMGRTVRYCDGQGVVRLYPCVTISNTASATTAEGLTSLGKQKEVNGCEICVSECEVRDEDSQKPITEGYKQCRGGTRQVIFLPLLRFCFAKDVRTVIIFIVPTSYHFLHPTVSSRPLVLFNSSE